MKTSRFYTEVHRSDQQDQTSAVELLSKTIWQKMDFVCFIKLLILSTKISVSRGSHVQHPLANFTGSSKEDVTLAEDERNGRVQGCRIINRKR